MSAWLHVQLAKDMREQLVCRWQAIVAKIVSRGSRVGRNFYVEKFAELSALLSWSRDATGPRRSNRKI